MNIYREVILDHAGSPRHQGVMKDATGQGKEFNLLCGDEVEVFVKVKEGKVVDVCHKSEGCAIAIAAVSILSDTVVGKSVDEVKKWELSDLLELLGTNLTSSRQQCAMVSLKALKGALK